MMVKEFKKKEQRGFTLIEIMVVIAIIGIMAAMISAKLGGNKDKAAGTAAVAQAKSIAQMMMDYKSDNGVYPAKLSDLYDGSTTSNGSVNKSGKVYSDPIRSVIGTAISLKHANYNISQSGAGAGAAAAAGGTGKMSYYVTYTGVNGQEALSADKTGDGVKGATTGIVHVTAGAGAGAATGTTVDIFVVSDSAY